MLQGGVVTRGSLCAVLTAALVFAPTPQAPCLSHLQMPTDDDEQESLVKGEKQLSFQLPVPVHATLGGKEPCRPVRGFRGTMAGAGVDGPASSGSYGGSNVARAGQQLAKYTRVAWALLHALHASSRPDTGLRA